MKLILPIFAAILLTGCSVVGESGVETAPYTLLVADKVQNIEVRNYETMVLVSTSMGSGSNTAFRRLFNYITGENDGAAEIAMTAPVIMNDKKEDMKKGVDIAMTAPVFMQEHADRSVMSFVMPIDFTMENTPKPTNPDVWVTEVKNYKVASIQFSGMLSDSNVKQHTDILTNWIANNGFSAIGQPQEAAYNGPLTIPMFRRNEVLIEIQ